MREREIEAYDQPACLDYFCTVIVICEMVHEVLDENALVSFILSTAAWYR